MTRDEYQALPEEVKLAIKRVRTVEDIACLIWLYEEARYSPKAKTTKKDN
jgi:hypothetical protein